MLDILITVFLAYWGVVAFRILIAVAINLDCRAENLAQRKGFTVLAFFFPLIIGIIYAIKRKSMQKAFKVCSKCGTKADPYANKCPKCGGYMLLEYKNPKRKTLKIISIVLCVAGVVLYGATQIASLPSQLESQEKLSKYVDEYIGYEEEPEEPDEIDSASIVYDRNGVAYSDYRNVKYYDEKGTEYFCVYDDTDEYDCVAFEDSNGKRYDIDKCFIDENGYFVIADDLKCDSVGIYHRDGSDEAFYTPFEVTWDYSGQLVTVFDE